MVEKFSQLNPEADSQLAKAELCLNEAHRIVRNRLTGLVQIEFEIIYLSFCGYEFSQGYLVDGAMADIGLVEMFLQFHQGNHEEWTYGLEDLWAEFPVVMTQILIMFSLANKFYKSRGHDGVKLVGSAPKPWISQDNN